MSEPNVEALELPYGSIVGDGATVHADGSDINPHPDVDAFDNVRVIFTPSDGNGRRVNTVIWTGVDGPTILHPQIETGRFVDGRLVLDVPTPPQPDGMRLMATVSDDMVPNSWGWKMEWMGWPSGKGPGAVIFPLAPGATVDIAEALAGYLPEVPAVDFANLLAVADEVLQARDEVQQISGLTGEDEAVAFLVADSGSASRAAVEAAAAPVAVAAAESVVADSTLPAWAAGPTAAKIAALQAFRAGSLTIGVASDSTANDLQDWPTLWLKLLAAANPDMRVDTRRWDHATQQHYNLLTIQPGTGGGTPEGGGIEISDDFNRTGNITGSTSSSGRAWSGGGTSWTANGTVAVPSAAGTFSIEANSPTAGTIEATVNINRSGNTGTNPSLRFYLGGTSAASATLGSSVWAYLGMTSSAVASIRIFKTIDGVTTQLTSDVPFTGLGSGSQPCALTFALDIQNVTLSVVTPVGTFSTTATIEEGDVAKLGKHAGVESVTNPSAVFAIDSINIETPYTPATPAPGLRLWNGAVPGGMLSYYDTRLATVFPDPLDAMIISIGHNNASQGAGAFTAEVQAFVADVQALHPDCLIVLSSQNPQYAPAAGIATHAARQAAVRELAHTEGWDYLPAFEQFRRQADGGASMVGVDGVHPTTPPSPYSPVDGYGATLWAKTWQAIIDRA